MNEDRLFQLYIMRLGQLGEKGQTDEGRAAAHAEARKDLAVFSPEVPAEKGKKGK